jgi:hypothetical protein
MKIRTWLLALAFLPGCGDEKADTDGSSSGVSSTGDSPTGEPTGEPTSGGEEDSLPPITGRVDIEAWLAAGHYLKWTCQDGVQDKILISIHGKQRICSNALVTGHPTKDEYPVDASSVKELYDEAGVNIVGYAVSRHVKAGTDGASWYWYKRVPADDPQMPDENGVVADGLGDEGVAKSLCVSCHSAAGNDADHPGHDFIYKVAD